MAEPSAILETPHAACLWAALCIPFSRPVLPRGAVVGTVAGLVRTSWTWGWFSQQGSGHGGRSRSHVKDWRRLVALHGCVHVFVCRVVRCWFGSIETIELAETLGSLGLNDEGDDLVTLPRLAMRTSERPLQQYPMAATMSLFTS
ncbi:hypothetical protein F511_36305 [Dorcoceras hygrometricum]|uniref:Uncharacterized protein n=1 Tax=Dorcoceras hygrometricum TaxID=472368 RepID=A0A2Z7AF52_9LAMI|nr:hypothetical protein F511_36305 [Dorcoceras hygrometricum]